MAKKVYTSNPAAPGSTGTALSCPDVGAVLEAVSVAAYHWDIATDRLVWSGEASTLLKMAQEEMASGRRFARRVDPKGPPGRYESVMSSHLHDEGAGIDYHIEYRLLPVAGKDDALWIEDNGRWYAGSDGRPAHAHGIVRAINERRARDERLIFRSDHDDLTGGLNRTRLIEELGAAIDTANRYRASAAFAIVAVDNLSILNDAYGFDVADEAIAGVAARIRREMRGGDVIGRLSGNKVGLVLNRCGDKDLRIATQRFARAVGAGPISTRTGAVAVTVSIGGLVVPRHGRDHTEALAHAQEALDEARLRGCAGIVVYEPSPGRDAARKRNVLVAAQIISALNEGRIALALQPIVSVGDGSVVFQEALCRLNLEDGTQLTASTFIETAEQLGIVRLVDHRALDLAVAALNRDPALTLSVNVSMAGALDGSWYAQLAAHVRCRRELAGRLIVEITETMAICDISRAREFVQSVRDLGCRVAIDDFGAGHTSFRNLRSLGADIVKIDGAFIERISENDDDRFFVATLVALAKRIGLKTVAERVAKDDDAAILKEIGVDYLQGHLYGPAEAPAPAEPGRRTAG